MDELVCMLKIVRKRPNDNIKSLYRRNLFTYTSNRVKLSFRRMYVVFVLKPKCFFFQGYESWTNWSDCSKSCGTGHMTASRSCINGPCSLSLSRELSCHNDGCKFNIIRHNLSFFEGYGSWTSWSSCSKSCGDGIATSSRSCFDGPCSLSLSRESGCRIDGCKLSL